jgi:hypothetical protein
MKKKACRVFHVRWELRFKYYFDGLQPSRPKYILVEQLLQIPAVAGSKAWVCGRSPSGIWVRIPPEAWVFFSCVLSGRGLCVGLITCREEPYRA